MQEKLLLMIVDFQEFHKNLNFIIKTWICFIANKLLESWNEL